MEFDNLNDKKEYEKATWEAEKHYYHLRRVDTILKIYVLFGILTAIFGISYFVLTTLDISLTRIQSMALLVSGVGFALAVASWGMLLIRREKQIREIKKTRYMQDVSDFLRNWATFENISKDVLQKEDRKFHKYSIREIIELLYEEGKIDKADLFALEDAIQLRNSVVHRGNILLPERARKSTEILAEIIRKVAGA